MEMHSPRRFPPGGRCSFAVSKRAAIFVPPSENLQAYRFTSPQFSFTAPTPWIFGETGGEGTSVGDGYFLMLAPLPKGEHTIHYGGTFRFTLEEDGFEAEFPKDITIQLTVE